MALKRCRVGSPRFEVRLAHGEERVQQMMAGVKMKVEEMRRQVDAMEAGR